MNVFLTMDYEVFFGEKSGSVDKCMIEPTDQLLKIAKANNFHFTFFWDIGHLLALEAKVSAFPELSKDIEAIIAQVKEMIAYGHAVDLHIHSHWEKAEYTNTGWQMNLDQHYKLSDFPQEERLAIFAKYKNRLEEITGIQTQVFRAGGWCIQPFADFKALFEEFEMKIDSSVMPGVMWVSPQYNIDFLSVKTSEPYTFSHDVCKLEESGEYTEYPIACRKYSPLFFWKLYVLGRLFPEQHKMWGDGNFIAQPGGKKEMLTKGKIHHVSTDGYFASELQSSYSAYAKNGGENMVVIGHPKSLTKFSLKEIDRFTARNKENIRFMTLKDCL